MSGAVHNSLFFGLIYLSELSFSSTRASFIGLDANSNVVLKSGNQNVSIDANSLFFNGVNLIDLLSTLQSRLDFVETSLLAQKNNSQCLFNISMCLASAIELQNNTLQRHQSDLDRLQAQFSITTTMTTTTTTVTAKPTTATIACPNNCNGRGACNNGICSCIAGYGGSDCSSLSCPNGCGFGTCTGANQCTCPAANYCCGGSYYDQQINNWRNYLVGTLYSGLLCNVKSQCNY
jgi:hypothetical protein